MYFMTSQHRESRGDTLTVGTGLMKKLDVDVSLPTNINLTHMTYGLDPHDL